MGIINEKTETPYGDITTWHLDFKVPKTPQKKKASRELENLEENKLL